MKINENDKILFSNIVKKHNLKKEGFLVNFFKRKIQKVLAKDKSLQQALVDGDKALDDLKKATAKMKAKGLKPSPALAKAMKQFGIK